jgi:plastocyanin
LVVALLILVSVSLAAGCSKSDKSTNPYGGGGGGTAPELSSGNIVAGAAYAHRFFVAKTYPYHCSIHPTMTGSIIVSASGPAGDSLGAVTIANFSFTQQVVTIPVGGKVTWTNSPASATHTVTSDP